MGKLTRPIRNFLQSVLTHTFTHICADPSVDTARCVALPRVNYGAAAYFPSFICTTLYSNTHNLRINLIVQQFWSSLNARFISFQKRYLDVGK
jgi:hypothetical protein